MTDLVKQDYVAVPAVVVAGTKELERTDERLKRAALARIALGYKELSLAVAETRSRLTIKDVEEGLSKAGVQIFDNKDVGRYKARIQDRHYRVGDWWTSPIEEYDEPIPEFAIDTALKIKAAIPEAEFSVEYYVRRQRTVDPFLSFKVPGVQRRFVVEVWDELEFEAERSKKE
jgi:hypothetical protein